MDTTGYQALGLGPSANFWDGSEQYWEPTIEALDTVWNTYDTIPVNRDKYLPNDVNLIAENNRSRYHSNDPLQKTEGDDYFKTFGFDDKSASSLGGAYRSPLAIQQMQTFNEMLAKGIFRTPEEAAKYRPVLDDKGDRRTLAMTDSGAKAMKVITDSDGKSLPFSSIGMHELGGHYYDDAIAGEGRLTASAIMESYGEGLSQEELEQRWMNDPRTNHLNLHDASNTGLRTLLRNRSHHGGVVNPQEGFGEYYASAITNPTYNTVWANDSYKMSNGEKIARRVGENMRPQHAQEGFGITQNGSNKKFADSLATFLNSR